MHESAQNRYEPVIGLEVHARLSLKSKLFSAESALYGAEPNTQVGPITLAHPGTLPKTNTKAIEYAVKLGLACNCVIEQTNYFARKNYFYPDLPKGYQISQHTTPICKGGLISIKTAEGIRNVKLNRIHLEEDAGKSIHNNDGDYTSIDLNRAGTALVEIVTEPDMHSPEEAYEFVNEIRRLVKWLSVCDGNMEEGSLRCDANVSVKPKSSLTLGAKVEIKNLNSVRNIKKAIEFEVNRIIKLLDDGDDVIQQTRSFDDVSETTFPLRDKEEANDYRYFPDPDLPPFYISNEYIRTIHASLPALPHELFEKYTKEFGLSEYDASQLCLDKEISDYFENVIQFTSNYKAVANWLNGPLKQYTNESKISLQNLTLQPEILAELIKIVSDGKVNFSVASSKLFPQLVKNSESNPLTLAAEMNLLQVNNECEIEAWVNEVIEKVPDKVAEYKKGKKNLMGLFIGEVKRVSKGKADPKLATEIIKIKLSK